MGWENISSKNTQIIPNTTPPSSERALLNDGQSANKVSMVYPLKFSSKYSKNYVGP